MGKMLTARTVQVKVGGVEYPTIFDEEGTQRFVKNNVVRYLLETHPKVNLNDLFVMADLECFSSREYAEFYMMLGYSVDGFTEITGFRRMGIENPEWGDN